MPSALPHSHSQPTNTPLHPPPTTPRHYKPGSTYYESKLTPKDLKAGQNQKITTFHYAGTGLAVLDADMVRVHSRLLEKVSSK